MIRISKTMVFYTIGIFMSALLVHVVFTSSYESRAIEAQLNNLRSSISLERDVQQTLRAEWSSLNDPRRLQKLAGEYLELDELRVSQIVNMWQDVMTPHTNASAAQPASLTPDFVNSEGRFDNTR